MKSSITNIALAESPNEPEGPSKLIRLIDLPGHPRLQDDVKAHLSEADGLVFVVDVQALLRNAGAIAEYVTSPHVPSEVPLISQTSPPHPHYHRFPPILPNIARPTPHPRIQNRSAHPPNPNGLLS